MRLRTKVATGVVCAALTAFVGVRIFVAHDGDQERFQEFVRTLGKWRLFNSDLRAFVTFEVVAEVERSGALPPASAEIAAAELRVWRESVIVEFRDVPASSIDWTATQGMPGISAADVRELANGGRTSVVVAKVEAARDLVNVDVALRTEGAVIDGYTIRAAWRTEGRLAGFRWFKHACEEMLEMSPRRRLKWTLAMALVIVSLVIAWFQRRRRRSGAA